MRSDAALQSEPVSDADLEAAGDAESIEARLVRVVLVDTRPERLRIMRILIERSGLVSEISEADSAESVLEEVGRCDADIVVLEIQMPVDTGLAIVAALRERFPLLRIVICSFHQLAATKQTALEMGADAYLQKPLDFPAFATLLRLFATTERVSASS